MEEKWAKHSSGQSTCPRKPLIYPYVYMNHDLELLLKQHADSLVLLHDYISRVIVGTGETGFKLKLFASLGPLSGFVILMTWKN